MIFSLQQRGNSNLFVMDLRSKATTRLTDTPAIDTAPSYSPDGSRICFEVRSRRQAADLRHVGEWRAGAARELRRWHLFDPGVVAARRLHRLHQAVSGQVRHRHHAPDGSGERILTEGYHNEGPTWSPNGRVIMFFRDPGGEAGPTLHTVDVTGRNEQRLPTPSYASDPAWSPLLP